MLQTTTPAIDGKSITAYHGVVTGDQKWASRHTIYIGADGTVLHVDKQVDVREFEDVVGRHFKQPKEGLGYDGSPVAHMWRTIISPNRFL